MVDAAVVMVAPNGARKQKSDHASIPLEIDEIAREAARCKEAGARAIHLHIRDHDHQHSLDAEIYRAAIARVKAEAGKDFVIQVTTEAVGLYRRSEQICAMRALKPHALSAGLREFFIDGEEEAEAIDFYAWAARENIGIQHILYTPDDVLKFGMLKSNGKLPETASSILFVLGRYSADLQSEPRELLPFLAARSAAGLDDNTNWMCCAFGATEARSIGAALCLGGHGRVGYENNMLLADGTVSVNNADLVAQAVSIARTGGRPAADAQETRRILGIADM